jgi:hypothetical protein
VYNGKTFKVRDAHLERPIKDDCYTNLISIALNEAQSKIEIGTPYHIMKNGNPESKFSVSFIKLHEFTNQLYY